MADVSILNSSAGISAKTVVTAEGVATITAAHTFSRSPSAPFIVTASSAVVTNLDADKLDGEEGSAYHNAANLTGTIPETLLADVGTGTETVSVPGRVAAITAAVATTGTVEEALATYTLPGSTLDANGEAVRITGFFTTAANGNNKQLRLRFGGISGTIFYSSTTAASGGGAHFGVIITRRSSTTAYGSGFMNDGTTPFSSAATISTNFAADQEIVVTGTTPTASADMTLQQCIFEVLP